MNRRREKERLARRRTAAARRDAAERRDGDRRPVRAGRVSALRAVPAEIPRPPYVAEGARLVGGLAPDDFAARMRAAGRAAAEVLREVGAAVAVGVTTDELDRICHDACIARGGYPSPLLYKGYPKSLCTSVNEVICHGIPDDRPLADGDIVNCDVTIYLGGVHGDCSATFLVGDVDDAGRELVRVTEECLRAGIDAARPGAMVNAIGRAIQEHAEAHDFGVVRAFVGHGIGEEFHTSPSVPHFYDPHATTVLVPGMTFTIEPMITEGSWQLGRIWPDGWTAPTRDLSRSAQFEHTLLVTTTGAEVLTRQPGAPRVPGEPAATVAAPDEPRDRTAATSER